MVPQDPSNFFDELVLKRHGTAPAPKRSQNTTWKEFIQSHLAVLAGTDFSKVEVLTWRGRVTYYVLFFIHLESRRVSLAESGTLIKHESTKERVSNMLPFPHHEVGQQKPGSRARCRERLGGLLRYYSYVA